jgi:hypothetical protein
LLNIRKFERLLIFLQVCSSCFLGILRQRLSNPLLPSSEHSDYLLSEYKDLQSYCSTSMPAVVTASRTIVVGTVSAATATTTGTNSTDSTPTACAGQLITPADVAGIRGCHALSKRYNVTTGDLTVLTNDWGCEVTRPVCLPPSCPLVKIDWAQTW